MGGGRGERGVAARVGALDGARAVALLLVVLFHGGVGVPGGAVGVDVFLVLSGYLISAGLLAHAGEPGALRSFWVRRARRLLPALLLLLPVVVLVEVTVAHSIDPDRLRLDALASLGYVANWRFVLAGGGYFEGFGSPSPLRHLWSLAVEEQFYVVWPVLLLGLLRWCRRARWLLLAIGALAAGSALEMAWLAGEVDRVHLGTDTRAQGFLVGAVIAVAVRHRPPASWRRGGRAAAELAGGAGLAALVGIGVATHGTDPWLYRGGHLVVALAAAGLLAGALVPSGRLARVLAVRPLAALGVISYGFYLWHWPVDVWLTPARVGLDGWPLLGFRTAVAGAVATASYVLIERPALRPPRHAPVHRLRWAATAVLAIGIGVALTEQAPAPVVTTIATPTIPAGFLEELPVATTVPAAVAKAWDPSPSSTASTATTAPPPPVLAALDAPRPPRAPDGTLDVAIVGDSTGWALGWDVDVPRGVEVVDAASVGCGADPAAVLIDGQPVAIDGVPVPCPQAVDLWIWQVAHSDPDVVLFTLGAWEVYDRALPDGTLLMVGTPAWESWARLSIEQVADRLVAAAPDSLIVLPEVPCFDEQDLALGGPASARNDPARVTAVNAVLAEVVAAHPTHLTTMTLTSWLCGGGPPGMRPDGVHLDPEGARLTWRDALAPALRSLVDG